MRAARIADPKVSLSTWQTTRKPGKAAARPASRPPIPLKRETTREGESTS
jgi:hypothetical protein